MTIGQARHSDVRANTHAKPLEDCGTVDVGRAFLDVHSIGDLRVEQTFSDQHSEPFGHDRLARCMTSAVSFETRIDWLSGGSIKK